MEREREEERNIQKRKAERKDARDDRNTEWKRIKGKRA